jgi:hypothetical protein
MRHSPGGHPLTRHPGKPTAGQRECAAGSWQHEEGSGPVPRSGVPARDLLPKVLHLDKTTEFWDLPWEVFLAVLTSRHKKVKDV